MLNYLLRKGTRVCIVFINDEMTAVFHFDMVIFI